MFHRLAGIAVTEQFVQVCAVRRWRLFDGSFLFCRSKQQQFEQQIRCNAIYADAGGPRVALQRAPALHYLACTEALARRFSNPRGQKRQEAGTPPICA